MKTIKAVKTYQAVQFEKAQCSNFTIVHTENKPKVELNLIDNTFIEVKSEKDHIYIPITNISCINFHNVFDVENEEFKKAEAKKTLTPTEVKRPK